MDAGKIAWHGRHCCLEAGRADTRGDAILEVVDNRESTVSDVLDGRLNGTLSAVNNGVNSALNVADNRGDGTLDTLNGTSSSVLDGLDNRVNSTGDAVDDGSDSRGDTVLDVVDDRGDNTGNTTNDVVPDTVDNRGSGILDRLEARNGTLKTANDTVDVRELAPGQSSINRLVQSIGVSIDVFDIVDSRGNTVLDAVDTILDVTNEAINTGELAPVEVDLSIDINVLDILSELLEG